MSESTVKKQIWFYDNSNLNKPKEENEMIHFVKVDESNPVVFRRSRGTVSDHFKEKGTKFAEKSVTSEYTDPKSGINESQMAELKRAAMAGQVLAVVFDWDRTLTKVEGLYTPTGDNVQSLDEYKRGISEMYPDFMGGFDELSDKEVMQYFFHNHDDADINRRPRLIGEMIRDVQSMGIPVFILTNSPIADISEGKDNRKVFTEMLEQLGVTIPVDHVLYNTKKTTFDRRKYATGKEDVIMEIILPMAREENKSHTRGGRRRKGTKRRMLKHRRTKKIGKHLKKQTMKKKIRKRKTHKRR